jgi:two-component system sensor histidine kinase EvgS
MPGYPILSGGFCLTNPKRILIADDDPQVLLVLRLALERMNRGYRIETAPDGLVAWDKFLERPFDLLISDVRMPRMDGLRLVEALRGQDESIPVILISAFGFQAKQSDFDRLKIDRCLHKPLRISLIRQAVLDVLAPAN